MKVVLTLLVIGLSIAASAVRAQVTVDVSKITCEQFLTSKIAPSKYVALWLSGYYNGQRNNTMLDTGTMDKNVDAVSDYCYKNRQTTVMDAIKAVIK
jgi:HdeA/HdeB family